MSKAKIPSRKELFVLSGGLSQISQLESNADDLDKEQSVELKQAVGSLYSYCTSVANSSNFWNFGLSDAETDKKIRETISEYDFEVSDGYSEQLYYYTFNTLNLERFDGIQLLEIGCGLGAGLNFLSRAFEGPHFTGVDICDTAIKRAESVYARQNIHFQCDDAENLSHEAAKFDVIINIESCHNYPNVAQFIAECARVLRPGGQLVVVDFFSETRLSAFQDLFLNQDLGLELKEKIDVSEMVKDSIRERLKPESFAMRHFRDRIGTNFAKRLILKQLYEVAIGAEFVGHETDIYSRTAHKIFLPASKRFTGDRYVLHRAVKV